MRQYKIEIICAEDFADKGVEVLEHITETLENIYGDAEWMGCKRYRLWRTEHHIQRKDWEMAKRHRIYVGRVLPSGSRKVACGYGEELKGIL